MKIKLNRASYIQEQKNSQDKCVELLGKGLFNVVDLEKIVEKLKNFNETLEQACLTTVVREIKSCGGTINNLTFPSVVQGNLYKNVQYLIVTLTTKIDIARANDLENINDFDFTDEQILEYGKQKKLIIEE